MALEVNSIIANSEAMQRAAFAFELAEPFQIRGHHFLGQAAKLAQNAQLKLLRHPGELGGARRIEDGLKRPHRRAANPGVARERPTNAGGPADVETGSIVACIRSRIPLRFPFMLPCMLCVLSRRFDASDQWRRVRESNPSLGLERAPS